MGWEGIAVVACGRFRRLTDPHREREGEQMKKVTKAKQTKYTPGPWCVDDAIRGQLYVMSKSSCFIADMQLPEVNPDEDAEVRANACLIAEAPNLLEACRAIQQWSWSLPQHHREADVWKSVDTAIVKAEGR